MRAIRFFADAPRPLSRNVVGARFFPGRQPSRRKALSLEARNYTATIL
jgi:hypothetical protein